jgi:hypothetical protein
VVEHFVPALEPVDVFCGLGPELLRTFNAASIDGLVKTTVGSCIQLTRMRSRDCVQQLNYMLRAAE